MKTRVYHVGLLKNAKRNRVTVQLRSNIDCLDCELWRYVGETFETKQYFKDRKAEKLEQINRAYGTSFTRIAIES